MTINKEMSQHLYTIVFTSFFTFLSAVYEFNILKHIGKFLAKKTNIKDN